jgi:large subunit ribosomal protein L17
MRKRKKGRKLSRESGQRKALLRSIARALFLVEKINTTEAKAKEIVSFVDKKITIAKAGGLKARRLLGAYFSPKLVKKLIDEIAPRYVARKGGYTRIIKLGPRKQDGARMAIIELVK